MKTDLVESEGVPLLERVLEKAKQAAASAVNQYLSVADLEGQMDIDRPDISRAACEAALRIDPDCCEAHFNLVLLKSDMGDWDAAQQHYESVARIDPESADVLDKHLDYCLEMKRNGVTP